MRGKLAFLILSVGATACGLLTLRQQRLEAVHELVRVQKQLIAMDQDLYRARVQIAASITPSQITSLAVALGPLRPIGVDPLDPAIFEPELSPSRLTVGNEPSDPLPAPEHER